MRKFFFIICTLYLYALPSIAVTQPLQVTTIIDWQTFMQKQNLQWETLPEHWYESAFMGNGMLGLMIYKEPKQNYVRFETGHCAVHDHRPGGGLYNNPRLLTGHFALYPEGEIIDGTMYLDIWNAQTNLEVTTTKGTIKVVALVHSDQMIMMVQTSATTGEKNFRWEWIPASAQSPRYLYAKDEGNWIKLPEVYELNPKPEVQSDLSIQKLNAGGETVVGWKKTTTDDRNRTYWISIAHSYPQTTARQEVQHTLERVMETGYLQLQKQHRRWWNAYYQNSFLTLPDGVIENFYWIQLYKLACATRADRGLIDNTGPWITLTPWPNAWWNLNVQLTYWPLNASNHLDLAESLENALYNNLDNLRRNVPEPYQQDALAIGRSSNLEGESEKVGIPGVSETAEVGLLTWACHNLWLIYRHKMDDTLLRDKLFPLLKQSVNYYLHFLHKEEDNRLHLPRTYSPEYGSAEDCNFDLALLRWGCQTLLTITDRLKIYDPLIPRWKSILEELTNYPTSLEEGLMIGRDVPYVSSHRHYSHLLAMYPLYLINKEQPGGQELIEKSLHYWQSKTGAHRGYSLTGASSLSSAIGKGNDALAYLNKLFDDFLSVNTLYRESGPVIETPLSAAQSIHDMLLQSWGNRIRIFPAVPDAWQEVAYQNMVAEGGFLITASRKKGTTAFVSIKSLAGEPCIITTDIISPIFQGKRNYKITILCKGVYQIDLRKNEEVFIYPENTTDDFIICPIDNKQRNYFGKKR